MNEDRQILINGISNRYGVVLLDKKNLQTLLGISASTLNRLISSSSIPYIKLNDSNSSQVKFVITDVVDMIYKNRILAYKSNNIED